MSGLLDVLVLTGGLLGQPSDVTHGIPTYSTGAPPDVTIHGIPNYPTMSPPTGVIMRQVGPLPAPSKNIEDRRYMTSLLNPFTNQADRMGPQGMYVSDMRKEAIEQGRERKRKKEKEQRFLDLFANPTASR